MYGARNQQEYVEEHEPEPIPMSEPYPEPPMSQDGSVVYPNKDSHFLQWLFNFKKEVTIPLRHLWRGHEQDDMGRWVKRVNNDGETYRIMNEKGITWAISLIESYINPVFIVSNYSKEDLNWTMRQAGRVVYNNLCSRYQEFELNKLDIQRVGNEIISKIHAILLGARNNGYRMFLSSTHTTSEVRTQRDGENSGGGRLLPNVKNLFFG